MKKILFALVAAVAVLTSCSDNIYSDLNSDPTRPVVGDPSSQLTFAELSVNGSAAIAECHRDYTYAFTQQLMGCWNTAQYGGQQRSDDNEMRKIWNQMYSNGVRDIVDAIETTKDDPAKANINAILRIFRVYLMSLLTDVYGDVPYFEAGEGYRNQIFMPKYDTQEEIYMDFFKELDEAAKILAVDPTRENVTSDPMFEGNIGMWKAFANSLRLRLAMRLSNVAEETAKAQFNAALDSEMGGVMTSADMDALIKHMGISYDFGQSSYSDFRGNAMSKLFYGNDPVKNPTYMCATFFRKLQETNDPRLKMYCRFYIEDYLVVSTGEGRYDITDAMYNTPDQIFLIEAGDFWYSPWPSPQINEGSALKEAIDKIQFEHPDYDPNGTVGPSWSFPKLAANFLKSSCPGVVMTYAEVELLMAEAAARGWIAEDAKTHYENGIRAAIQFLVDNYGFAAVDETAISAYLSQPSVEFGASLDQRINQINTQAWILHFTNPFECWANVRRSGAPALQTPEPMGDYPVIDKGPIPVRLLYPLNEASYNAANYKEAIGRIAGDYNWHAPMWWIAQ